MSKENQTKHDREVAELWEFLRESERISRANAEKADKETAELRQELRQSQQKTAEQQRKTDEQLRETAEQQRKTDEQLRETAEQQRKTDEQLRETAEQQRKTDEQLRETDKQLKKTGKQLGDFVRSTGEVLEVECLTALEKMDKIGGIKIDDFQPNAKFIKKGMEVDIVGYNGKVVMPIEVKRTLRPGHIHKFVKERVDRFKREFASYAQGRDVHGAVVFTMRAKELNADNELEDPVKLALDAGLIVLQSISANNLKPIHSVDDVVAPQDKQYLNKKPPGKK